MSLNKQKKRQDSKGKRLLITINVVGTAGPLRFVVNEEELVSGVIEMALKTYAREGRRPILGSDVNDFLLYSPAFGAEAFNPWDMIGTHGVRNFVLCKKLQPQKEVNDERSSPRGEVVAGRHGSTRLSISTLLPTKLSLQCHGNLFFG